MMKSVSAIMFLSVLMIVVADRDGCLRSCEGTCGDVGITTPAIDKLTTCAAKCDACIAHCKTDIEGGTEENCPNWCTAIRLPEPIALFPERMKAKCLASSVPEHHTRYP